MRGCRPARHPEARAVPGSTENLVPWRRAPAVRHDLLDERTQIDDHRPRSGLLTSSSVVFRRLPIPLHPTTRGGPCEWEECQDRGQWEGAGESECYISHQSSISRPRDARLLEYAAEMARTASARDEGGPCDDHAGVTDTPVGPRRRRQAGTTQRRCTRTSQRSENPFLTEAGERSLLWARAVIQSSARVYWN